MNAYDEVGTWSEVKLDIIREYAAAYSRILAAQHSLHHVYIDAFAGAGVHVSRSSGDFIPGSPLNALLVKPPFEEFHLIDMDSAKVDSLRELTGDKPNVHIYEGDCNAMLLQEILPSIRYEDHRRGLCLLDPYGLHLDWEVVKMAGNLKTIDIFINFPVMDINRNVLRRNPEGVSETDLQRMDRFWGDRSWKEAAYQMEAGLFEDLPEKQSTQTIAEAYRTRLKRQARFKYVPEPMPFRHSREGLLYYLFFAAQKKPAENIIVDIFEKHRERQKS